MFDRWLQALAGLVLSTLLVVTVFILLSIWAETGPNCPGKDPEWLGFCKSTPTAL